MSRDIYRTGIPGYNPWQLADGYHFDADLAAKACKFFPLFLRHVEGACAGKPFRLEGWQRAVVGNLFGWLDDDGYRRYRTLFLMVPRKNGKTPLAAGIGAYVTFCDGEIGQQNYCAAADREQAGFVYRHICGMIEQEPALAEQCRVYRGYKSVEKPDGSFLKVISAEANTKHGGNSHLILFDELHAQPNRELVDVLTTSMASAMRKQPLLIYMTTSDYDRPSICNEIHDYARRVRDGEVEDAQFLPVLYEASLEESEAEVDTPDGKRPAWQTPEFWSAVNPNIGVSVSEEYLKRECLRAREEPTYENTFKRLHLNIRTSTEERLIPAALWQRCAGAFADGQFAGQSCMAGLDIGATSDLTSLCLVFGEPDDMHALWWHWMPRDAAREKERKTLVPYVSWARDGWLTLTDGDEVDYATIRANINQVGEQYAIEHLAVDRLFQGAALCQDLARDGFSVIEHSQGPAAMSAPTTDFINAIKGGRFHHGDNPLMAWQSGNVVATLDSYGNIKPDKKKSGNKIDGIVACIMAISLVTGKEKRKSSVYESRGVLRI